MVAAVSDEKKKRREPIVEPIDFTPVGQPNLVDYPKIRSGEKAVGFGAKAKDIQEGQRDIPRNIAKATLLAPRTALAAGSKVADIAGSAFGAVKDAIYRQKKGLGQATTQEEDLAFTERAEARFPAQGTPVLEDTKKTEVPISPDTNVAAATNEQPSEMSTTELLGATQVESDIGKQGLQGGWLRDETTGERYAVGANRGDAMRKVGADGEIAADFQEKKAVGFGANRNASTPYDITDSTWTPEETERFRRQPGKPGTRMVSRGHPDFNGPAAGTTQYGAGRRGTAQTKRESRKLKRDREYAGKTAAADVAQQNADTRSRNADIAEQSSIGSQQKILKLQSLQQEFSRSSTTPERKNEIEREIGILGGSPLSRRGAGEFTEKQRVDAIKDIRASDDYKEWVKSKNHRFSEDEPHGFIDYIKERPELKHLAPKGGGKPATVNSKADMDKLNPGDKFIYNGKTYTR